MTKWISALAGLAALAVVNTAAGQPAKLLNSFDQPFVSYADPVIALTHASVLDGTGAAVRRDMTLVMRGGRIAALGPSASTPAPAGARVIDATGKTLLPGLVMVHEHTFYPTLDEYEEFPISFTHLYLAGGETTIRTAGSMAPVADINTASDIAKGKSIGPDMDVTGPYLDGPQAFSEKMVRLKDPVDARRNVDFWTAEGATSFKAYMNITRAELKAAIEAAHAHGLKVTGHLCSVTFAEAAALGIDNLEHSFAVATDFTPGKTPDVCPHGQEAQTMSIAELDPYGPQAQALIHTLIAHKVALTTTLTVFETTARGRPKAPEAALALLTPALRETYETIWAKVQTLPQSELDAKLVRNVMALDRAFVAAGGMLLCGTDPTGFGGVVPGYSGKRELELLAEAGFSAPEAINIATLQGARYLGREKQVGSLEIGKRADVVVVDGDVATDMAAVEHMPIVFKAGVGYLTQPIFDRFKGKVGLI